MAIAIAVIVVAFVVAGCYDRAARRRKSRTERGGEISFAIREARRAAHVRQDMLGGPDQNWTKHRRR